MKGIGWWIERAIYLGFGAYMLWFAWQVVKMHITNQAREQFLKENPPPVPPPVVVSVQCHSLFCKETLSERELFYAALIELAYDPGWPEDPVARIEEMKSHAFYTLRAAKELRTTDSRKPPIPSDGR